MKTVRVRIAVVVTDEGAWSCAGWSGPQGEREPDKDIADCARDSTMMEVDSCNLHWVEADVPMPEMQTVKGEVVP